MKRFTSNRAFGINRSRPGGRLRLPTILRNTAGKITAVKNAPPPSQGRGMDGIEGYKPITNEPRTNSEVVRSQLQKHTGIQMPTPETRQQRRQRDRAAQKAERIELLEAQKFAAYSREEKTK